MGHVLSAVQPFFHWKNIIMNFFLYVTKNFDKQIIHGLYNYKLYIGYTKPITV